MLSRASIPTLALPRDQPRFFPLRRPPASSDSPSTVWSSRSLQTRNVSVFLPFFLREALIRHANACNTRSRPAGLAPLLVPGPLYGKASIVSQWCWWEGRWVDVDRYLRRSTQGCDRCTSDCHPLHCSPTLPSLHPAVNLLTTSCSCKTDN